MRITTVSTFECENIEEYEKIMESIEDDLADIEDINEFTDRDMTLEVTLEDKENLKIETVSTFID